MNAHGAKAVRSTLSRPFSKPQVMSVPLPGAKAKRSAPPTEPGPAVLGVAVHPVGGVRRADRQVTAALRGAAEHARAINESFFRIGA